MRSYGQELTLDFQRKYASLVLDIEKLNEELNKKLVSVQQFCQEVSFKYLMKNNLKYTLMSIFNNKLQSLISNLLAMTSKLTFWKTLLLDVF